MRRLNDLPLKVRLTLLYVGLFSALLVVLASAFYLETRHYLIAQTAADLRTQAEEVLRQWQGAPMAPPPAPPAPPSPAGPVPPGAPASQDVETLVQAMSARGIPAAVVDASGNVLASAGMSAGLVRAASACAAHPAGCTIRTAEGRYRVLEVPLEAGGVGRGKMLLVARSLRPVERVLMRQLIGLGVGLAVLLVLGTLLGLWLTSSALRPLDEMAETCNRIAAGDLSQRVNLPHRNDEIGRLAAAFDHMADQVEATMEAQQRFIASAAHELRTPLAALQGTMDVLLRGALDDPPTAHRLTQNMYREVTRLFRLCDQLLGLSRAQAAETIHKRPVALASFFREFMTQAGFLAQERSLTLREGPPLTIAADPDALKRVLFNLVDNAVQHTPEGGEIAVGWREAEGGVEIFVTDDGEGIAPEDLPHIFEPFYRGDRSRSRRRGGAGLGLAIVETLVEAHGGRVTAASSPGRGTTITIWLPVS